MLMRWRRRPLLIEEEPDTDARLAGQRRRVEDPQGERRARVSRRAAVFVLASVCGAGLVAMVLGEGGLLDMVRLQREIASLEQQVEVGRAEVLALEQSVADLGQGTIARERVAREQLGLVRPGEIDFLLPRPDQADWGASGKGKTGRE